MSSIQTGRSRLARVAGFFLAVLALATVPGITAAWYGGHYGGHHYGHHGGHHYGYLALGRHFYGRHHSYPYRYGYSYRRHHYTPSYSRYSYRSPSHADDYDDDTYDADTDSTATYQAIDADQGWDLLGRGVSSDALQVFAQQANNDTDNGRPKIGYALAAAASGNLKKGVWAMRRAVRIDPDALHYLTVDGDLHQVIENLAADYGENENHHLPGEDAAFMRASLYYLQDNANAARHALPDDDQPSTRNLDQLIEQM